jgi:hypothetical protein
MKAKQQVLNTLARNAATRNSDRLLMLSLWREQGLELTPQQEQKFMEVTSPETIRRERQKIQADGLYQSNDQIRKARAELEVEHRAESINDRFTAKAISWIND